MSTGTQRIVWHIFEGRVEILSKDRRTATVRTLSGSRIRVRVVDLFDTPEDAEFEYARVALV